MEQKELEALGLEPWQVEKFNRLLSYSTLALRLAKGRNAWAVFEDAKQQAESHQAEAASIVLDRTGAALPPAAQAILFRELYAVAEAAGASPRKLKDVKPYVAQAAPPAEELTFEGLFLKPEDAARTIQAMKKLDIVNTGERWNYGRKKGALAAIWDFLKAQNKVRIIPDAQAVKVFAERFETTIAERTSRGRPTYYKSLYSEFAAIFSLPDLPPGRNGKNGK